MKLEHKKLYSAYLSGAMKVMEHKNHLNNINVFPVSDGDTGTNLFSMMSAIVKESQIQDTFKKTFESIADAALTGARGNSGIIFAQYLNGMSMELSSNATITLEEYVKVNQKAVQYAYNAISNPVEGTILTAMNAWSFALMEFSKKTNNIIELYTLSLVHLEEAVKHTQFQLSELRNARVVDSGAKGFLYFVAGILEFLKSGKETISTEYKLSEDEVAYDQPIHINQKVTYRYCTEAMFTGKESDLAYIKEKLADMGDSLVVAGNSRKMRVHIHSDDPATVFEIIRERAKITHQKADDMKLQNDMMAKPKSKVALVTDSIADLPIAFIEEHQIHVVNLSILFEDLSFIDKVTIRPKKLLEYSKNKNLPTSSQPDIRQIENMFNYLLSYYESIIVITVSNEMSGTFRNFYQVAKGFNEEGHLISVIDSKQNSGAEGLIVMECANEIFKEKSHAEVLEATQSAIDNSKIFVCVKTLDNMIKSGRLSIRAGKIAKTIGMKPIVSIDKNGKAGLSTVAFSFEGSQRKLIKHLKSITKSRKIKRYSIVHVDNEQEAVAFAVEAEKIIKMKPSYIDETSSIIAIGAGEGTIALSYILEE